MDPLWAGFLTSNSLVIVWGLLIHLVFRNAPYETRIGNMRPKIQIIFSQLLMAAAAISAASECQLLLCSWRCRTSFLGPLANWCLAGIVCWEGVTRNPVFAWKMLSGVGFSAMMFLPRHSWVPSPRQSFSAAVADFVTFSMPFRLIAVHDPQNQNNRSREDALSRGRYYCLFSS